MDPSDDYRPRPDDHHVEPLFGGLGVGESERGEPEPREPEPPRGFLARLRGALARITGGRASRPERDR